MNCIEGLPEPVVSRMGGRFASAAYFDRWTALNLFTGVVPLLSLVIRSFAPVGLLLVALLSILVMACSSTAAKTPEVSLLFMQTASSGSFEPVAGSTNKYRLVLNDVSPSVVYFSDRPNRLAGHVSTAEFLDQIGFGGALDPNAAIDMLINGDAVTAEDLSALRSDGGFGNEVRVILSSVTPRALLERS